MRAVVLPTLLLAALHAALLVSRRVAIRDEAAAVASVVVVVSATVNLALCILRFALAAAMKQLCHSSRETTVRYIVAIVTSHSQSVPSIATLAGDAGKRRTSTDGSV